jgi:hypothetical protein
MRIFGVFGVLVIALSASAFAGDVWEQAATPKLEAKALGLSGLKASDCGVCHTSIYEEWRQSTHAQAWVDPQFQAEISKDPDVAWLCQNCHTPVSNQQAVLSRLVSSVRKPEKQNNTSFNADFRDEGVTCLACHWRPQGIAAPHRNVNAPHRTVYAPDLADDKLCSRCHQATARLEDALVCHFNTGVEKAEAGVDTRCSSCHMPTVNRPVVLGGTARVGGVHSWAGSGLGKGVGPAVPGLQSLAVSDMSATRSANGELEAGLIVSNIGAGHMVPTGDPERYILLTVSVVAKDGTVTDSKTWRIGQTWVWSPVAKQIADNRLGVGEKRGFHWRSVALGEQVRFKLEHVRVSDENHTYHLEAAAKRGDGANLKALQAYPTRRTIFEEQVLIR